MTIKKHKKVLRNKLIDFLIQVQRIVIAQKKCIKDNQFEIKKNQKEHLLFLIEVLDNFEKLNEKISHQQDSFDPKALRVFKSFDIIKRKISNYLESQSVQKIVLDKNKVEINLCEVVDTEKTDDHNMKGKIKHVLHDGYMYSGEVLKSARIITYH